MTLHRNYMSLGKEVLRDGRHVADACDPETAKLIAEALNHAPPCCDPVRPHGADDATLAFCRGEPDEDGYVDPSHDAPATVHHVQRQNDEYACKCGVRWPVSEGEEHP